MTMHRDEEHNTPEIIEALKRHHLKHDAPSQLADAFRLGWAAARVEKRNGGKDE